MPGLGGFILGGALSGIGAGMQKKVEDDVLARREARIEALRQQERAEDRTARKEDLEYQNTANAEGDVRRANLGMASDNNRFANEAQLGAAAAVSQAEAAKAAEERKIAAEARDEARQKRLIEAGTNAEIRKALATREEKPEDIITDNDGNVTVIYSRNGQPVAVPLPSVRGKKAAATGSSSLLGSRGPAASTAAPPAAKAMTQADIAQTARDNNLTFAEAKAALEARGYTLSQ